MQSSFRTPSRTFAQGLHKPAAVVLYKTFHMGLSDDAHMDCPQALLRGKCRVGPFEVVAGLGDIGSGFKD